MMQSLVKFRDKKKGFTLVELIVVIAIIGILAAILMPRFMGFTDDARKNAVTAEAKSIRTLAESYYASYGDWPLVVGGTSSSGSATGFKVQTGSGSTDADNSPTFAGTINIGAGSKITDGAFIYEKNGHKAEFDASGTITNPS